MITMYDTLGKIAPILRSTAKPRERFAMFNDLILHDRQIRQQPRKPTPQGEAILAVYEATQRDGGVQGRQGWGLFNPTRNVSVSAWELDRMIEHEIFNRVATWLNAWIPAELNLTCMLVPADPANEGLMVWNSGLSCGGLSHDYCSILLYPSDDNLARLPVAVGRMAAHNIWIQAHDDVLRLRDWIELERFAQEFVAERMPLDRPVWQIALTPPDSWEQTLDQLRVMYAVPTLADMPSNVYGSQVQVFGEPLLRPTPLDADEIEYSRSIIEPHLDSTDPRMIAACLYGDEVVGKQGHPTLGLSPFAGFQAFVGLRLKA